MNANDEYQDHPLSEQPPNPYQNKPVAWMFRGYLYEKDPSDWTVHEHPDVPVIPLYTHPAKTLTDEEIMVLYEQYIETQYASESNVLGFGRAILRKAQEK
jgi:hypothetical protein